MSHSSLSGRLPPHESNPSQAPSPAAWRGATQVILAELDYEPHYSELHDELVALVEAHFAETQHGLQGDSWIWIFEDGEKVAIDSFSSMKHQVKSAAQHGQLAKKVIAILSQRYRVIEFAEPEPEPHDDEPAQT